MIVEATHVKTWHETADVVVVGSGAGGLAAAIGAAEHGARTVVLERAATTGGTTYVSAGAYWIHANRWMREGGLDDPREDALRFLARTARPERYAPDHPTLGMPDWAYEHFEAFYDHGAEVVERLEAMGVLRSVWLAKLPGYYSHLDEDVPKVGRTIAPAHPDGSLGRGSELIAQLQAGAEQRGVPIKLEHRVTQLVRDDDAVVGVLVDTPRGEVAIRAARAVIFASGGFTHDREIRDEHLVGPVFGGAAAPTTTGDFVGIGQALGARMASMQHAWFGLVILERALETSKPLTRNANSIVGDSILLVNRHGRRTFNEKAPYNEKAHAMLAWDGKRLEYPNLLMFPIWDQRAQDAYGGNPFDDGLIPGPDDDRSHVIVGATLEELEHGIRARLDRLGARIGDVRLADGFGAQLAQTIARFNEHAVAGHDPDFARGETLGEQYFHRAAAASAGLASPAAAMNNVADADADATSTMHPLSTAGPYYATIIAPGVLDTKGGPITNARGQVLDADGAPFPGLYAVGNCAASPFGRAYIGGGATLGPIITTGWLAGERAATGTGDAPRHAAVGLDRGLIT